jgi:hypothetical protein
MDIKKTVDKVERFDGEWLGEKFWVEAKTYALTPDVIQKFANMRNKPSEFAYAMADILTAWDVDWNGEPFPPVGANLLKTSQAFLEHILDLVAESWSGNAQRPSDSASGSAA